MVRILMRSRMTLNRITLSTQKNDSIKTLNIMILNITIPSTKALSVIQCSDIKHYDETHHE